MSAIDKEIMYLKGVGPKRAELFKKLGISTVRDLIYHLPRDYTDFSQITPLSEAQDGEVCAVEVEIVSKSRPAMIRKGMTVFKLLATDNTADLAVTIFNAQFQFDSLKIGEKYILCGKIGGNLLRKEMSSPLILSANSEDKIQPIYPLTAGISQNILRICIKNALSIADSGDVEILPPDILKKTGFMPEVDALRLIHFPRSIDDAAPARRRLAFDELLTLRLGMMGMKERARRETTFSFDKTDISPYLKALPYELTGAQKRAISDCVADMKKPCPMNRLILGDVGSGKTAVAAACCYIAAMNSSQAVMMAPTEILAMQHYESLKSALEPCGISVGLLIGSMKKKQRTEAAEKCASGEYQVIVGTHAVFQEGAEYQKLGLVITDEQHRFGVEQRAKLSAKGKNPHRLVMSATPIPRTLALMIYGELDISLLDELPAGRKKIETYAVTGKLRSRACAFVRKELDTGGQAYIVCPAVEEGTQDIKNVADYAKELADGEFKGYRIGVLHGQMTGQKKDAVMKSFKDHELDILVCTTVVEVGVDVPNATVMVVENADRFGLSQLHQLRGRVGRGKRASYCILITDNATEEVKKRLRILSSTPGGFEISEADLELRGPGDFFGSAQHGLPPLKIADLAADQELIRLAQETAEGLTSRLTEQDCANLRRRVYMLYSGDKLEA